MTKSEKADKNIIGDRVYGSEGNSSRTERDKGSRFSLNMIKRELNREEGSRASFIGSSGMSMRLDKIKTPGRGLERLLLAETENYRKSEREQNSRVRLLHEMAFASSEADEIPGMLQFALERIVRRNGWQAGHAIVASSKDTNLSRYCLSHTPRRSQKWQGILDRLSNESSLPFEGLLSEVIKSPRAAWFSDPKAFSSDRRFPQPPPFKTYIVLPIVANGDVAGVMEFFSGKKLSLDHQQIRVLESVGRMLGRVVERKWSEQEISQREERFRAVFENAGIGTLLVTHDERRIVRICNRASQAIFGYDGKRIQDLDISDLIHPDDFPFLQQNIERIERGRDQSFVMDARGMRKDGRETWLRLNGSNVAEENAFVLMCEDITDQREKQEQIRRMEKELADLPMREQQRLGRELHDGLGQEMTAISMLAESLHSGLKRRRSSLSEKAADLTKYLRSARESIRRISHGLFPQELESGGLVGALDDMVENAASVCSMDLEFDCNEPPPPLEKPVELHLFRIAQEAVHNAMRHSGAKKISVYLKREDGNRLILEIRDNGKGFGIEEKTKGGSNGSSHGLRTMDSRARIIGASLKVDTNHGEGILIRCVLPGENACQPVG